MLMFSDLGVCSRASKVSNYHEIQSVSVGRIVTMIQLWKDYLKRFSDFYDVSIPRDAEIARHNSDDLVSNSDLNE